MIRLGCLLLLLTMMLVPTGSARAQSRGFCDPRQPYTDYDGDPVFAANCELTPEAARKIKKHYTAFKQLPQVCPNPGVVRLDADATGAVTLVCRREGAFGVFDGRYWKTCPGAQDSLEMTGMYADGQRSGRWETYDCTTGRRLRVEHYEKDILKGSRILWKPDGSLDKVDKP